MMTSNNMTAPACFEGDNKGVLSSPSSTFLEAFMGSNLARPFLIASFLPCLVMMYFLGYSGNRTNAMTYFGFQYVLVFSIVAIPAGIVTQSQYGLILLDVDWLHGAAEFLLTVSNVALICGLTESMTKKNANAKPALLLSFKQFAIAAYALAGLFVANTYIWAKLNVDPHFPLLFGLGDLPRAWVQLIFGDASHQEPANALSIATWFVHISSEIEYLFIMNLVWKLPDVTKTTPAWKGLTWGMLPMFAAGLCACTFHLFYNSVQFIANMHGIMTLVGSLTSAIAAYRIARANGWSLQQEVKMLQFRSSSSRYPTSCEEPGHKPLGAVDVTDEQVDSKGLLVVKLIGLTLVLSYVAKYGAIACGCIVDPHPAVPLALVFGISSLVGMHFVVKSRKEADKSY